MGNNPQHDVPHLTTALTGPLQKIESLLLTHQTSIERWFRSQWMQTPAFPWFPARKLNVTAVAAFYNTARRLWTIIYLVSTRDAR